jgi:predicted lactoylglutathione lyase
MEPRLSLVTLGVTDLGRARAFYEQLGWRGQEVEETVFFAAGGTVLVLWGWDKLALDAGIEDTGRASFDGVVLAHNVRSAEEVEQVVAAAENAGATMTRPPGETFYGGYAACFADPDGHIWEISFNPGFTLDADGSIILPDFGTD